MEERPKLGLENATGRARLRGTGPIDAHRKYSSSKALHTISDVHVPLARELRRAPPVPSRSEIPTVSFEPPHLPKQSRSKVLKRQVAKPVYKTYPKHRLPLYQAMLAMLLVIMVAGGVVVLFFGARANRTAHVQAKQSVQSASDIDTVDGTLSETESTEPLAAYQTAPDAPRFLVIEKMNVKARIRPVGKVAGDLLAPSNIYDVGWYDGSAKPGAAGTVVMDGHVSGPSKWGVFYSLGTLSPGDKLVIERGDGKTFSYSVTATRVYDNDNVDMDKVLTSSVAGKPALNLITASGRFNVRTNQFEPRLAVFAAQD